MIFIHHDNYCSDLYHVVSVCIDDAVKCYPILFHINMRKCRKGALLKDILHIIGHYDFKMRLLTVFPSYTLPRKYELFIHVLLFTYTVGKLSSVPLTSGHHLSVNATLHIYFALKLLQFHCVCLFVFSQNSASGENVEPKGSSGGLDESESPSSQLQQEEKINPVSRYQHVFLKWYYYLVFLFSILHQLK